MTNSMKFHVIQYIPFLQLGSVLPSMFSASWKSLSPTNVANEYDKLIVRVKKQGHCCLFTLASSLSN